MTSAEKAIALRNRAFALREEQEMEAANDAICQAVKHLHDDPQARFAQAQIAFETGRRSVHLFDAAKPMLVSNPDFIRNRAAAYVSEGMIAQAAALLGKTLAEEPEWLDGHRALTSLRVTSGDPDDPARSYATAVLARPDSVSLRLAWFHQLSSARQWDAALRVITESERALGPRPTFDVARAFIASESGEAANDTHLFDHLSDLRDPGLDLCQVRHFLRLGDPVRAIKIAERNIRTPAETAFWPYLSLAWRQTDDARANWLDRPDHLIRSFDLDFSKAELQQLAETLRTLHIANAPFVEQSVRGGTQTTGNLFLRHEPAIALARAKVLAAVRSYISSLPPLEPGHPLLGRPRDTVRFEGSWSVRLGSQGHHACHTHARGWISSALYVALPSPKELGAQPGGWIEFGGSPPELALDTQPYRQIEPATGKLILFPSTLWHRTLPFSGGERLTIAFDIR